MKPSKLGTLTRSSLNEDYRYDLYAVCYHQGDTLETGHYTAACKNPYDQNWYKYDDQRVSMFKNEEVSEKLINNEAYMLFYQRRKVVEGSESSGASTSSAEHWVSKIAPVPGAAAKVATKVSTEVINDKKEEEREEIVVKPEADDEETKQKPAEKKVNEITSALNIDDIEAIDGDDIPEVTSEPTSLEVKANESIQSDEPESEDENAETPVENKVTIQVEVSSSSPAPELERSPQPSKDKNSNDMVENESTTKRSEESDKIEELMSQQTINNLLWNDANNNNNRHSDVGAITISDLLSMDRIDEISSTSLPKNYMLQECEPISRRVRGVSSCSKDTLLYIDQQGLLEDDSLLENRAHWVSSISRDAFVVHQSLTSCFSSPFQISPVTPHKLITVSPKN